MRIPGKLGEKLITYIEDLFTVITKRRHKKEQ